MEKVWIPVFALVAVVLQTTIMPCIAIYGIAPDLIFLLVIFLALQKPNTSGLWITFAIGLLQDIAGGAVLGLNALVLVGLAYLISYLRKRFFKENFTAQMLIVGIFTVVHQFLMFFWMNTMMHTKFAFTYWIERAFIISLLHALIAPFLFSWLAKFVQGENIYKHLVGQRKIRLSKRN